MTHNENGLSASDVEVESTTVSRKALQLGDE